jgi:hypothetical protein
VTTQGNGGPLAPEWPTDETVDPTSIAELMRRSAARAEAAAEPHLISSAWDCPCRNIPRWAEPLLMAIALANLAWIGWMELVWFCQRVTVKRSQTDNQRE